MLCEGMCALGSMGVGVFVCVCVCVIFSLFPIDIFLLFFRYELGQLGLGEYEQKLHDLVPISTLKRILSIKKYKETNVNGEQEI